MIVIIEEEEEENKMDIDLADDIQSPPLSQLLDLNITSSSIESPNTSMVIETDNQV